MFVINANNGNQPIDITNGSTGGFLDVGGQVGQCYFYIPYSYGGCTYTKFGMPYEGESPIVLSPNLFNCNVGISYPSGSNGLGVIEHCYRSISNFEFDDGQIVGRVVAPSFRAGVTSNSAFNGTGACICYCYGILHTTGVLDILGQGCDGMTATGSTSVANINVYGQTFSNQGVETHKGDRFYFGIYLCSWETCYSGSIRCGGRSMAQTNFWNGGGSGVYQIDNSSRISPFVISID